MNADKQRIAIAEFCGWVCIDRHKGGEPIWWQAPWGEEFTGIPNYLNDLNAMHEAVQHLRKNGDQFQWLDYTKRLFMVIWKREPEGRDDVGGGLAWGVIEAKADQRAEALLRTIGKWEITESENPANK